MTAKSLFDASLRFLLPVLAAASAWQPAAAQREVAAEGTYLHGPARAAYPERVGKFRRSDIYQYDQEGKDVSASYNLATPEGRLLVTIYIYPAPPAAAAARAGLCDEEFGVVKSVISSQHDNVAPAEQGAALKVPGVAPGL
ncbi:MAG: hypothetical protein QOJ27_1733, partial [Sphingomonadales bacterium]|nr:hypothetical protein [Sphingomonadales bacterium]